MKLPVATICHQSAARMRIKVASRRGDADYFARLVKTFAGERKFTYVTANPVTGSVIFIDENLDSGEIAALARKRELFHVTSSEPASLPLMHSVVQPMTSLNRSLRTITGGNIDLPSGIFFALLGVGIYQLARGRLSAPPWYTAFWYAFGLISMYVIEKASTGETVRCAD